MAQGTTGDLGQRRLAAIVFTDVVGFSARMQEDETNTLRFVERDAGIITKTCTAFNGRILKSTGDGFLMFFDSAVDAVAAALKVQEEFGRLKANLSPRAVLEHRIGIHLGDVFIRDDDVMGDGVNIAARLQKEAGPGGICISQTVYEVVKNKLSLQVVSLGPRDLKNIRESVPAYQIIIDAQKVLGQPGRSRSGVQRKGSRAGLFSAVVLILLAAAGGYWYVNTQQANERGKTSQPVATVPKPKPTASVTQPTPPAYTVPASVPSSSPTPPQPNTQSAIPTPEPAPPTSAPIGPAPPSFALTRAIPWIQEHMFSYSKDKPLKIVPPPRVSAAAKDLQPTTAWMEGNTLHFNVGGKDTPSALNRASPIVLEYVLYSLTQAVGQNRVPPPIRRIFEGGPPPQGEPDMSGQPGAPPPPEAPPLR